MSSAFHRHSRRVRYATLLLALTFTACSGSDDVESPTPEPSPAVSPTEAPTATPELPTATPEVTPTPKPDDGRRAPFAAVVTSDYSNGTLSLLHLDSSESELDLLSVGGDTLVEGYGDQLYLLMSSFSGPNYLSIHKTDQALSLVKKVELGNGVNPRDVAFVGDKGYVSLFNGNAVQIFDPATGELGKKITLSDYADADGDANPLALEVVGDTLYVGLARIDYTNNYLPTAPGYIIAIDTKTDEISSAIETTGNNLSHLYALDDKTLVVSSIGTYGAADGGIEGIDLVQQESVGYLFSDETLGVQDKGGFTAAAGLLFMVIDQSLTVLEPINREILPSPEALDELALQSVTRDPNGRLWLGDLDKKLWVYDPVSDALLTESGRSFTNQSKQQLYSLGFVLSPTIEE